MLHLEIAGHCPGTHHCLYIFPLGLKSSVFDEPGNHAILLRHVLRFDLDPRTSVQCIHEAPCYFFEYDVDEKSERIWQRHRRLMKDGPPFGKPINWRM